MEILYTVNITLFWFVTTPDSLHSTLFEIHRPRLISFLQLIVQDQQIDKTYA